MKASRIKLQNVEPGFCSAGPVAAAPAAPGPAGPDAGVAGAEPLAERRRFGMQENSGKELVHKETTSKIIGAYVLRKERQKCKGVRKEIKNEQCRTKILFARRAMVQITNTR